MTTTRERLRLTAVTAVVAVALVGCGRGPSGDVDDDPPASTGGSGPTDDPTDAGGATPGDGAPGAVDGTLTADPVDGATGISVAWTWTNRGDEPVYVVDGAPGPTGSLSKGSAYVVGLPDGTVQVSDRLFEQPASDPNEYYAPFYAGVSKVSPGDTVRREVTVPATLEEAKPFGGYYAAGEAAVPSDPTAAVFCVGVLVPPYRDGVVTRRDGGLVTAHGSTDDQTVFCSDEIRLAA